MKKFIFVKNSSNVYDSQLGVIDTLSEKYGHEEIKTWAKIDYSLPVRIIGNSATINSTVLGRSFNIDETLILDSLGSYDMVMVAALISSEGAISEETLFDNFTHYGIQSDGQAINLATGEKVAVSGHTWYVVSTTFKVDTIFYMVINNNIANIVETLLEAMMEGSGVPHEYIVVENTGLKNTIFKPVFSTGKMINGKTLYVNSDTLTIELTTEEPIDITVEVDTNMQFTKTGLTYTFNIENTHNFIEFSIPNSVFEYFSKEEELSFQYEVTKYG